ncbi:MAG: HisA/HisF-related TIM barrel protein, partial [Ignavibacteriaceae bacterium]|nr:HisA/HisF-related TIM barrel protein [Ignavibacteriaceae bacterium]
MNQKLLVIPSIDIKNGKCVRTVQGIPELDCYEYGNNPVQMAKIWRAENAKMIHVTDFDGAHEQSKRNYKVIEEICSSVVIPVEFAGGIRTHQDADEIMKTGVIRLAINS